ESMIHAGILLACAAIQLVAVWSVRHEAAMAQRLTLLDLPTLAAVLWTNTLIWPFLGHPASQACARLFFSVRGVGPLAFSALGVLTASLEVLWIWFLARGVGGECRWKLVGSYVLLAIFCSEFSVGSAADKAALIQPGYSGRYFYVPTVLVVWLLLF